DLEQPRADAGDEALAHGLLFGGAGGTTAEDEGVGALALGAALHLQPLAQHLPGALAQGGGERPQPAARRADDVARAAPPQPGQRVLADHAAVEYPDAAVAAVAGFHAGDDLGHGGAVVAVAGEDLVAQGVAVPGHDQADQHLFTIAAVVARVAALGLRVGG